ncbi:MAG: class I SAM-dependent methyltransferase [Myxococcales bacterium]|nr:class I SAM-dependent methyltransferase [Myxococcales bacterium]
MAETYAPFDWYETPLYYDIVFDEDTQKEAAFLQALHARHVRRPTGRLLEPACGSGRLVAAMAKRGFSVSGFDASEGMIAFARARTRAYGARVHLSTQTMQGFSYKSRFDMAFCLVSTFKYLLTETDAQAHLERVAACLRPGGVYLLGFHLTDYDRTNAERERWVQSRGDDHVTCNIQIWPPERRTRLERARSRLVVRPVRGKGSAKRFETNWHFRTYSRAQFLTLIAKVPSLRHVDTHDFDYDPDHHARFGEDRADVIAVLRRE